jgi:hypothetical protein
MKDCTHIGFDNMKRIGLIDVDGRNFPNIALMKISAYYKAQGHQVEWYMPFDDRYDVVFMSKVFSFTPDYDYHINADKVFKGGTGYAISLRGNREVYDPKIDSPLPSEIESMFPDYSLYNISDTAYGFLTRGCPRGCDFCIVGKKEGKCSRKVADLKDFWKGQKNIVLCDPNILACKDWKELLQQLIDSKANVDFNQGLDIRLMTTEKVEMLNQIKIKEIHFAWDRYQDKDIILPKLEMYSKLSNKTLHGHNAIVYTITNFDTTFEEDLERIYTLRDMGYWAYVMIYNKKNCDPKYKKLQRWVNMRSVFASTPRFEDYNKRPKETELNFKEE